MSLSPTRVRSGVRSRVRIKSILLANGYLEHIINSCMARKIKHFHVPTKFGPKKCPVYLRLPWLCSVSTKFEMQVKSVIQHCFTTMEPRVFYTTSQLLPATKKDVLPSSKKSNVIDQFSRHCDSRYVDRGRTSQRLHDKIKQHVPKSIRSGVSSQKRVLSASDCKSFSQSATQHLASGLGIELYLQQNPTCAQHYMMKADFPFLSNVAPLSSFCP